MQFLVEHQTVDRAQITLCETLGDVRLIADELAGEEFALGLDYEGELAGEWGVLRYAPAV